MRGFLRSCVSKGKREFPAHLVLGLHVMKFDGSYLLYNSYLGHHAAAQCMMQCFHCITCNLGVGRDDTYLWPKEKLIWPAGQLNFSLRI
jgi:hypothetical protein